MSDKIIAELIACRVSSETIVAVAHLIADARAIKERRAADAERKRNSRERNQSVRGSHGTSRDVTGPPPAYTTPPKEIKPKKVLSAKHALPTDFELWESDKQHAFDHGWTPDKLTSELARFRDHATANSRKQADWHAAWRNWVTSPFQKSNGKVHDKPSVADIFAGLGDRESESPGGLLSEIGRRRS